MPQSYLHLQRLEVVRDARFGFAAHSLARPLLEAIELLIDIHVVVFVASKLSSAGQSCASGPLVGFNARSPRRTFADNDMRSQKDVLCRSGLVSVNNRLTDPGGGLTKGVVAKSNGERLASVGRAVRGWEFVE